MKRGWRGVAVGGAVGLAGCGGPTAHLSGPRVGMADGVSLAVDVVLPPGIPADGVPVVLIQTRYWRSFEVRGGGSSGRVPPAPREPVTEALVAAGFGVVVADVRGTGASEGRWPYPWSDTEQADGGALIDWIAAQPWSDGRVGAYGTSYEGTTALLAASQGRPALKAVLAREIEWELSDELLAPGGVRNVGFVDFWGRSVMALDRDGWPELFPAVPRFFVHGVRWSDDDPDGSGQAARVAARTVADVAGDASGVRGPADRFGAAGPRADALGPAGRADALASSTAAVGVWGSWWDGATADGVLRAAAEMPVLSATIGPWDHAGGTNASPLGRPGDATGTVDLASVVDFFTKHLAEEGPRTPERRWWVAGEERFESGPDWPQTTPQAWHLRGDGTLGAPDPGLDRRLAVDFAVTVGWDQRWTAGILRPVASPDRAQAGGLLSFHTGPLPEGLSVFGAGQWACEVSLLAPEAALHIYLEAVDDRGRVPLLTEGVLRAQEGPVSIRLRPVAFALPAGQGLRLSIAGADAAVFERVPAEGPQEIRVHGASCALTLPVR